MKGRRGDFRNTATNTGSETRVRLRIRWRVSDYSGGRAERALSAGERQQGGEDKLRMIDRVRVRSRRDIKAPANPPRRTRGKQTPQHARRVPNV